MKKLSGMSAGIQGSQDGSDGSICRLLVFLRQLITYAHGWMTTFGKHTTSGILKAGLTGSAALRGREAAGSLLLRRF